MLRSLGCFALLASVLFCGNALAAGVTVLTYHDIVADPGKDKYGVSLKNFESQLQYLKQNNYHPISLGQFIQVSKGRAALPSQAVLLTFDDGLISYRDNVVPLLAKYGYPSVLSIVTDKNGLYGQSHKRSYKVILSAAWQCAEYRYGKPHHRLSRRPLNALQGTLRRYAK